MIIYFSATGNNKYIAQRIAAATGDTLVSIADCVKEGRYRLALGKNESIGFITPTYFWGLPSIVTEFVDKLKFQTNGDHYAYHVLSYGTITGAAHADMARLLKDKSIELKGRYIVKMVDTWTPMFDISDSEKNRRDTEAAEPQIDKVIERVKAKTVGDFNTSKGLWMFSGLVQREYQKKRATKYLRVTDGCIGCGLCAEGCPAEAIKLQNGRPVWVKDKCVMCLRCLHRCPRFAIQYGDSTEKHGQFVNPNVKL